MKISVKRNFTAAGWWTCVLDCPAPFQSSDWTEISWKSTLKRGFRDKLGVPPINLM